MNLRSELPGIGGLDTEWRFAVAQQETAPCAMGLETREVLFKTVRAMGARSVLDIGTYRGHSALNFALAVGQGGRVVTVDIKDWEPEALWRAAHCQRIERHLCDSRDYLAGSHSAFDFISIDGWHEDFCVYQEIPLAIGKLNPDGLIFVDDYHPPHFKPAPGCDFVAGPYIAVQRLLKEGLPVRVIEVGKTRGCAFLVRA